MEPDHRRAAPLGGLFAPQPEPAAHARHTDPATSHEAAASVTELTEKQRVVLDLFEQHGPMADHELLRIYRIGTLPPQSDSGLRTRRSELVAAGKLVQSGPDATTPTGRRALRWDVPGR